MHSLLATVWFTSYKHGLTHMKFYNFNIKCGRLGCKDIECHFWIQLCCNYCCGCRRLVFAELIAAAQDELIEMLRQGKAAKDVKAMGVP